MKKYISLYKQLLVSNWNALVEYRSDFVTQVFSSLVYAINHVVVILLLTSKVPSAYGWTRSELLLLTATYNVFMGIYHTFISRNLDSLSDEIYLGRLDYVLLRPIDSQVSTMLWRIHYVSLVRLLFGLALSFYLVNSMQITITLSTVIAYVITILAGVFILYSIWLPFISLIIFNPRLSNIISLLFQSTNIARYPKEMYARLPMYIFIPLIPLALIMTTPTKVLVQKFSFTLGLEVLAVSLIVGIFARFVWKFSLRYYTSASS